MVSTCAKGYADGTATGFVVVVEEEEASVSVLVVAKSRHAVEDADASRLGANEVRRLLAGTKAVAARIHAVAMMIRMNADCSRSPFMTSASNE